jgi:hypothetical protein
LCCHQKGPSQNPQLRMRLDSEYRSSGRRERILSQHPDCVIADYRRLGVRMRVRATRLLCPPCGPTRITPRRSPRVCAGRILPHSAAWRGLR